MTPFARSDELSDRLGFSRPAASGSRTRPATSPARTRPATSSASCSSSRSPSGSACRPGSAPRPRDRELRQRRARRRGRRRRGRARRCASSSRRTPTRPCVERLEAARRAAITVCERARGRRRRPDLPAPARGGRRGRAAVHLPGKPERARGRGRADARLGDRRRPARTLDRLVVQVGGGALASACCAGGSPRPIALGALGALPAPRHRADRGRLAAEARLRRRRRPRAAPAALALRRARTAPSSCGPGRRSRTASPTASSTTRPTTGSPSSRRCSTTGGTPARRRRGDARAGERARPRGDRHRRRPDRLVRPRRTARAARRRASVGDDERVAVLFTGVSRVRRNRRQGDGAMRSFLGRDILSLKDFERADFERVFEVCDELAPIARNRRNTDLLAGQDAADGLLPAEHAHPDVDRGRDAPARRPRARASPTRR